jgi:hypothetical protein
MSRIVSLKLVIVLVFVLALSTSGCTGKYEGTIAIHNDAITTAWYVIQSGYQPSAQDTDDLKAEAREIIPGSTVLVPATSSHIVLGIEPYSYPFTAEQRDSITIIVGSDNAWDEYTFMPVKDKFGLYVEWDGYNLTREEGVNIR